MWNNVSFRILLFIVLFASRDILVVFTEHPQPFSHRICIPFFLSWINSKECWYNTSVLLLPRSDITDSRNVSFLLFGVSLCKTKGTLGKIYRSRNLSYFLPVFFSCLPSKRLENKNITLHFKDDDDDDTIAIFFSHFEGRLEPS